MIDTTSRALFGAAHETSSRAATPGVCRDESRRTARQIPPARRRALRLLASTALCAAAIMTVSGETVQAATYAVTQATDDGSGTVAGSLSWAIANASSDGDVIEIDPALDAIAVSGVLPDFAAAVTIKATAPVEITGSDFSASGTSLVISGVSAAEAVKARLSGTITGVAATNGTGGGGNGGEGGNGLSGQGFVIVNDASLAGNAGGTGGKGAGSGMAPAGSGGEGGAGGNGVSGTSFRIDNLSTIRGGAGGAGGDGGDSDATGTGGTGGTGGAGGSAVSGAEFFLNNAGSIEGGHGGSGGALGNSAVGPLGRKGNGGAGGAAISGTGVTVFNSGTITGGSGGSGLTVGAGGAGISVSNATIVNSGTISGGLSGDGSNRANAIEFTSGTNSLELQAGYTITGNVIAGGGSDTLVLGGDTNPGASFDLGDIGTKYNGFEAMSKTGSSTWTMTGTAGAALGDLTVSGGSLNLDGATATANLLTVNGGTLIVSGTRINVVNSINLGLDSGQSTLTVANLAQFVSASPTYMARDGGTATLNIGAAAGEAAAEAGFFSSGLLVFGAGDGTVVFNHTNSALFFTNDISGKGTIEAHAGTTTLTGNNSAFTGTTVVNGGTLRAGGADAFADTTHYEINGGTLDLGGHDLTMSRLWGSGGTLTSTGSEANLILDQDDVTRFSGEVSGLRNLTKTGFGTVFLRGNTAVSGTIGVDEGVLSFGGGKTMSSGRGSATAAGTRDAEFEISGAGTSWTIGSDLRLGDTGGSGSGNLWIFDKAVVSAASLHMGDGGKAHAEIAGAGSVLTVTGPAEIGVSSGGSAAMVLSNGGRLVVGGGTGTVNLAAGAGASGTLVIGAETGRAPVSAGTLEAQTVAFGAGDGTIVFNHTDTAHDFKADVTGDGTLALRNGETLLSGDYSGFTGSAEIYRTGAARLQSNFTGDVGLHSGVVYTLDTTLAGTFTVNDGARLQGNGTVGGLSLASGGTLAPGNSIGTINVAGDASFGPGSIYAVEVDGTGGSDLTTVTGRIDLTGGTVNVSLVSGATPPFSPTTSYTIMTGAGGVFGRFDSVTDSLAFLDSALVYQPNAVVLELTRNGANFASQARTANQFAVATSLDDPALSASLFGALIGLDAPSARAAYDSLSGEIHASLPAMFVSESARLRDAVGARIEASFSSLVPQASGATSDAVSGPLTSLQVWAQTHGAYGRFKGDGNAATLSSNTGGGVFGLEASPTQDVRLGLLAGFSRSTASVDNRRSSATADSFTLGAYGAVRSGAVRLEAGVSNSWHQVSTRRHIAFGGIDEAVTADYGSRTAQAFADVSYRFETPWLGLEPYAGLAVVHQEGNAFQERGSSDVALAGKASSQLFGSSNLGVRLSKTLSAQNGTTAELTGTLGWQHAIGSLSAHQRLALAGIDSFSIQGVPIDRDTALVQAGVRFNVSEFAKIGVSYQGRFGRNALEQGANARLEVRF
ncbi:autotransporter domain-containing protein [Stappia stellulata]|uniref:autotransporter domain-containing protein n=1 Tax=Stappia stellulata TaxID=71235 RepID=UPI000425A3F0|nr:autotransporter domain-containing protein [Stappia stellulata]